MRAPGVATIAIVALVTAVTTDIATTVAAEVTVATAHLLQSILRAQ